MTTKATGNGMRDVVRLATDHLLEPTLSHLTGSDILLSGRRVDGTAYHDRMLTNVSFIPRRGSVFAVGLEPGVGIRQFRLSEVDRMAVVGPGPERRTFTSEELAGLLGHVGGGL